MVDKKIFAFLGIMAVGILLLVFDISMPNTILSPPLKIVILIFAIFFDLLALSSRFYSYLIIPIMKQRKRNVVISKEEAYFLASSGDAILHKEGENYIATIYIKIPLYRSATEMTAEEKLDFTHQNSRLIALSKDPIRFTTELLVMNKDSYIQTLRDMISAAQDEENRLVQNNAPASDIERARGKAGMWSNMLDITSKSLSLEMSTYATVSGVGVQEFEAVGQAGQRARELMSGVASIFGVTPSIITGDGLLRFVEPEYLIPYSTISEQINKGMRAQVL